VSLDVKQGERRWRVPAPADQLAAHQEAQGGDLRGPAEQPDPIQNKRTNIRTGIPFLIRVVVLGYLFGSTEEKIEKTEPNVLTQLPRFLEQSVASSGSYVTVE